MKCLRSFLAVFVLTAALSSLSFATQTFTAILTGAGGVPPTASPGTGIGTVVLDLTTFQITVNESWSGLVSPAIASHIHGPALPTGNAAVLFPFTGVPNTTSGAIPQQTFSITAAQITDLQNGLYYMNLHTSAFPGGEIRGQLILNPVPEPSSIAGLTGFIGMGAAFLRRRKA